MSNGPIEPHADIRQVANLWFQTYTASIHAGFTPDQAMQIVNTAVAAAFTQKNTGGNQ